MLERHNYFSGAAQLYVPDEMNRVKERVIRANRLVNGQEQPYEFSHEIYNYDGMRRLSTTDRLEDGRRDWFFYMDTGELNQAFYGTPSYGQGGPWTAQRYAQYYLDRAGNRYGVDDTGTSTNYTPNALNQYSQTANGSEHEISGYGPVTYRYLGDTFLAEVNAPGQNYKLGYDALGRCVRRETNGQVAYSAYDGAHEYYSYDALSRLNLTDRRLRWSQSGTIERTGDTFGYNDAAELTAAGYGLIPNTQGEFVNPVRTMNYFPDNAGNRLSVNANGTATTAYDPNNLNQYRTVGNNPVTNGGEHEIANYDTVTYRYLGDTRLARVSSSTAGSYELGYDALGRCVRRSSNGVSTYYIYDGERPIIEYDAGGTITARNTYGIGIDELLARDTGALFYHQDRLGNVSAVTDALGQVVEQYRYDAFGAPEIRSAPVSGNPNGAVLTGTLVNNRFLFGRTNVTGDMPDDQVPLSSHVSKSSDQPSPSPAENGSRTVIAICFVTVGEIQ